MAATETAATLAERLSGLLRVAFTDAGAAFDVKQQRVQLAAWLARRRDAGGAADVADNAGAPSRPLSWSELTGGMPESTPGYAAHERHYRSFLAAVSAALGGEAPPEELANAASTAFRCLQACAAAEPEPAEQAAPTPARERARLQRARAWLSGRGGGAGADASRAAEALFGSGGPGDEILRRMVAAHAPLHTWLQAHRQHNGPAGAARTRGAGTAATAAASGFGSQVRVAPCCGGNSARRAVGADWLRKWAEVLPETDDADDDYGWVDAPAAAPQAALPAPAAAPPPAAPPPDAPVPVLSTGGADLDWLRTVCARHVAGSGGGDVEASLLCATLLGYLYGPKSDAALQEELLSLLGFEAVELVAAVLPERTHLAGALSRVLAFGAARNRAEAAAAAAAGGGAAGAGDGKHGCSVTLNSASGKAAEKARRKEDRKLAKEARRMEDSMSEEEAERLEAQLLWLAQSGFEPALAILSAAEERAAAAAAPSAAELLNGMRSGSAKGLATALPAGTTRVVRDGYEEVSVPPILSDKASLAKRMPVSELPEHAQLAFKGVTSLNQLQTAVVATALHSHENMLVCAPTGAGKTNVALLAICEQVGQCIENGVLHRDRVKVVYIAPMKALAAELVGKFGRSLAPLGLQVREYTGDMQLTKRELVATQVIVTTPEKWDVTTRKGSDGIVQSVGLLIIDEVHLLNEDRGPVIEALVARTLRLVESSQQMIRIVGLSATLPNYVDVALFLRVNPQTGLFFFGAEYRPVPLKQTFVGVTSRKEKPKEGAKPGVAPKAVPQQLLMLEIAYDKTVAALRNGKQVMVFVHARNETLRTARGLLELARTRGHEELFAPKPEHPRFALATRELAKCRNGELRTLAAGGLGTHHAGMLRPERSMMERLFGEGMLNVLVSTATLAWGVNLPAHTVIIKGTQVYDAQRGAFTDVGVLDVQQIFGRAGRPQFDTDGGEGIIITTHAKLASYLSMLVTQTPIESKLVSMLCDHLGAEVALGTVTSVREAVVWLSYTYLYVRMCRNPLAYGIPFEQTTHDPRLATWRAELVQAMARRLDECRMVRYHPPSGSLDPTELGRIASHFYLSVQTVEAFSEQWHERASEADILHTLCSASEFANMKVREEEMEEMEELLAACPLTVKASLSEKEGKASVLTQAYISGTPLKSAALMSDCAFIAQSASRIARGLFAIALAKSWVSYAEKVLKLSKMLERRVWWNTCPLRQIGGLPQDIYQKLEAKRYVSAARIEALREMGVRELGQLVSNQRQAAALRAEAAALPVLAIEVSAQPITRTVLRVTLRLTAAFEWRERVHGGSESWWIWVEDSDTEHIYHKELWTLSRRQADEVQELTFTTPLFEPLPPAYYVRAFSDRWLGVETVVPLPLSGLALPSVRPTHTELLPLRPLPKSALGDPSFERLFRFSHFNPVQTQIFHTVMHTDVNVLVGAPTGSGKTVTAELAVMRMLREQPGMKAVYIAPLKALVRERMADWRAKFVEGLGLRMQELTGDVTPDGRALASAHILATTPEKWDGVSRHWQQRGYVRQVGLVIIDEIHLLGEERGPILEVIVSRMRYMAERMGAPVRIVGLSTAMANASDLADWLGIPHDSIFNFKPSVRPVPLEVHIAGFPGQHYCPRMAAMNKPAYRAITVHSPGKPALVFVSSRRQTRLTALDLIAYCSADERESQFLAVPLSDLEPELAGVRDPALRHTLAFGIGIHHAGLEEPDRVLVERLFLRQAILVLVCTSTLAWGVNFPAHLVVVKGTEYFDGKAKRYVDFPVTDVLQMMGRAGRPQYDDKAVAVILVHEPKKTFYKKFLYEPFPVESCLHEQLHNHINAEVVGGTIRSKQDAVDFLSWTYFYRRLLQNPAYYHCAEPTDDGFNRHLSSLVEATLADLEAAGCVGLAADGLGVEPLPLGQVASHYYLQYTTVALFHAELHDVDEPPTALPELLRILAEASEFDELPVRHNEEHVNAALAGTLPWPVDERALDSPHVKAQLLLQAHFAGATLPMSDYVTDLKSVLDQALRVLQAMVDIAADAGWLHSALGAMHLTQMVSQGRFLDGPQLSHLPGIDGPAEAALAACGLRYLPQLIHADARELTRTLSRHVQPKLLADLNALLASLPATTLVAEPPPHAVAVGAECAFGVTVGATNPRMRRSAHAPAFPKARAGGWWLVLGEGEELFALKRVTAPASARAPPLKTELLLCAPEEPGTYTYDVYLVSDSYIGLDQVTTVTLVVV